MAVSGKTLDVASGSAALTGTLAAGVASTIDLEVEGYDRVTIVIRNTGGSNAIGTTAISLSPTGTYFGSVSAVGTAVGSLSTSSTSAPISITGLAAKLLRVSLTSASGSTYAVEAVGYCTPGAGGETSWLVGGVHVDTASTSAFTSVSATTDDATTNGSTVVATLSHTTSGTATAGIGAGLLFKAEDGAGSLESAVQLDGILTTVTDASEVSALIVKTRTAGGALTEALRVAGSGLVTAAAGFTATTGAITATTGDLAAVGGFRQTVGPFTAPGAAGVTAAGQTALDLRYSHTVTAAALSFVAPRAGSIMGMSAQISAAVTGAAQSITVQATKNGTEVGAALDLAFTQAGGETTDFAVTTKDSVTFVAGDIIGVSYTSNTITNTPALVASLELEF